MSAGPEKVASGSFRVDRRLAVAKLGRWQYKDPKQCCAALLRAAALGGASRVDVRFGGAAFVFAFDGEPLSCAERSHPFDALFVEGAPERSRLVAAGLMALCRLSRGPVSLCAGAGAARRRLTLDLEGGDSSEPLPSADTGTSITAPMDVELYPAFSAVAELTPLYRPRVAVDGRLLARFNPRAPGFWFDEGPVRGWLGLPPFLESRPSRVHLSYLGVSSRSLELLLPLAQAEVWVNDDGASTDLSGLAAAAGERWERLVELLRVKAIRFILRLCEEQPARLRRAARAVREDRLALACWRRRVEMGPQRDPEGLTLGEGLRALARGRKGALTAARTLWAAHATLWLRELVHRFVAGASATEAPRRVVLALGRAPIFIAADGGGVSWDALQDLAAAGRVPASRRLGAAAPGSRRAVWCPTVRDYRWLKLLAGAVAPL